MALCLNGLQRLQILTIPGPLARSLHLEHMLKRANADDEAVEVDILGLLVEDGKRRHLRKALEHADLAQLGRDQSSISGSRRGGDGGVKSSVRFR